MPLAHPAQEMCGNRQGAYLLEPKTLQVSRAITVDLFGAVWRERREFSGRNLKYEQIQAEQAEAERAHRR